MKEPLNIIYIPGLGDANVTGQRRAVSTWRWWGVEAELFQMKWFDDEAWESKLRRLLARIDALTAEGKPVALVGASAGAAAVINAFAGRKDSLVGAVLIAGKVNRPETVGQHYIRKNPSFLPAVQACQAALATLDASDRQCILSRYALADETVYKPDSRIPGAHNRLSPTIGHALTIGLQITLGAPSFIHFLQRLQSKIK